MKEIQGNRLLFELARGWSWRGFELSGVNCNIFQVLSSKRFQNRDCVIGASTEKTLINKPPPPSNLTTASTLILSLIFNKVIVALNQIKVLPASNILFNSSALR